MDVFLICVLAGFGAQLIDGSLGMGFGISLSIFLYSMGIPPITVSASVHIAKVFSAMASGISHLKLGNVDRTLVTQLAVGGMLGAIFGTYFLTNVPTQIITPLVAFYLVLMGLRLLFKALGNLHTPQTPHRVFPLGVVGGFLDAIGGGGWGAIVTGSLIANGQEPRVTIGSVSLAEFFVAMTVIGLLVGELPELMTQLQIIVGLILGSMLSAPLAAYLCGRISARPLSVAVGGLLVALSMSSLLTAFLN